MNREVDCKTVSRWLSDSRERELDPDDQARLKRHFGICESCRNVERQMTLLHRAITLIDRDRHER